MPEKLYVLVRKDLVIEQQVVQAGHAIAEYLLRYPECSWSNGTLVLLGVQDQEQLRRWSIKLDYLDIPFAIFREPDLNNEITAISTSTENERIFRAAQLWSA